jgi:RimJ/RimL family protein N-acetyltransferase
MNFPHLPTQRLQLRPLTINDLLSLYKYRTLKEVYKYKLFQPQTIEEVKSFIEQLPSQFGVVGSWFQIAVTLKDNGVMIGDLGVHFLDEEETENIRKEMQNVCDESSLTSHEKEKKLKIVEIGYTLSPTYQRQGYGYEAVNALVIFLFDVCEIDIIIAETYQTNVASIALMKRFPLIITWERGDDVILAIKKSLL